MKGKSIECIPTYVRGLDSKLQGGIPRGSIILICGLAGSMKSAFTYSMLWHASIDRGLKGIYITLEQKREHILMQMEQMGMPVQNAKDLVVIDLTRLRKDLDKKKQMEVDWTGAILQSVEKYAATFGVDLFALDSLQALYALQTFENPRNDVFNFFEALREIGVTSYLISEMSPDSEAHGFYGVEEFLCDGIIHLNIEHGKRAANLFLAVLKMRRCNHQRGYFPLLYDKGMFEIITD